MVAQYPHSITVMWKTKPTQDMNGDWVEGSINTFTSVCRAEANGEGKTLTGVDGSTIYFSYHVFMPKTSQLIPFGAAAEITISGSVASCSVKQQYNGQLNSRLWL